MLLAAIVIAFSRNVLEMIISSSSSVDGIPRSDIAPPARLAQNASPTTANAIGNVILGFKYQGA